MSESDQNGEINKDENAETEETSANSEVEALKNEIAKWKNDFLYLKAEFENFKKRSIKERADLIKYGGEYAFMSILTALDNFERALKMKGDESSFKSFKDGIELIAKEFKNILQQFGVTEVQSEKQKFDPNIHEAVGSVNSDDVPEGHIVSVLRSPYKFYDKNMRTGQVIVSLGPKKEDTSSEKSE